MVVDAVCMNAGFEPQNEILRLLGARMRYDPAFGHLRCERGETLETTVPGLFAVGDCAGLGGAPAARTEGRIAGRAAAIIAAGVATRGSAARTGGSFVAIAGFRTSSGAFTTLRPVRCRLAMTRRSSAAARRCRSPG